MSELVLTPAALLDILRQIDELSGVDVGITEELDGSIQLQVGDSIYSLDTTQAKEVAVDDATVEAVETENIDTYNNMKDDNLNVSIDTEPQADTVKSGIIKEIAKTLLVGGLVRLTGKLMK